MIREFRPYRVIDQSACLELFDANCPAFFAPNERADYIEFLEAEPVYYKVCLVDDQIVGAFGLNSFANAEGAIRWILIRPEMHGHGIGSAIMEHVLAEAHAAGMQRIRIAASHRSAPFFARFGAEFVREILNGWGPGMHRVDMELHLISPQAGS